MKSRNILDILDELAQERTYEKYEPEDPCSIDLEFKGLEGELEGVGLVFADFSGTSRVTHYSYDHGSYWQPPDEEIEAEYGGELSYTKADDETEGVFVIEKRYI